MYAISVPGVYNLILANSNSKTYKTKEKKNKPKKKQQTNHQGEMDKHTQTNRKQNKQTHKKILGSGTIEFQS
jgi:hypothetical protein